VRRKKKKELYEIEGHGQVQATVVVEFDCPLCPAIFAKARCSVIRDEKGRPAILHPIPYCKPYEELSPDEYLKQVRMKLNTKWQVGNEVPGCDILDQLLDDVRIRK
jgi:hypothetical protein